MTYIPYMDRSDLTRDQKELLIPAIYFTALAFLGLLIFACYNYYTFLLKAKPRRKLSHPVSMFYLVAICVVFLRIFSCIFMVQIHQTYEIIIRFFPGLFKLNAGLI